MPLFVVFTPFDLRHCLVVKLLHFFRVGVKTAHHGLLFGLTIVILFRSGDKPFARESFALNFFLFYYHIEQFRVRLGVSFEITSV